MTQQYLVQPKKLNAGDFQVNIDIEFEDGNCIEWEGVFTEVQGNILAVYTEHCGYHAYYIGSIDFIQVTYSQKQESVCWDMSENYPDEKFEIMGEFNDSVSKLLEPTKSEQIRKYAEESDVEVLELQQASFSLDLSGIQYAEQNKLYEWVNILDTVDPYQADDGSDPGGSW